MINLIISLSVALFSYQLFSLTAKISSLNKTMINIPLSLFSYSVPLVDSSTLHFDKETLENKLDEYFANNVTKHVNNYQTKYTFYSSSTSSVCMSDSCDIVKISLDANVDGLYTFHRTMKFKIGSLTNG